MRVHKEGRWTTALRRTLLALSVAVIAVCIVSMHQLSSDHALATADPAPLDRASTWLAMTAGVPADLQAVHSIDLLAGSAHPAPFTSGTASTSDTVSIDGGTVYPTRGSVGVVAAPSMWMPFAAEGDGCQSCAPHVMLMVGCVLALTLVVGRWLLRSPTVRLTVWSRALSTFIVVTGPVRVRPALSLVELSLRRT